MTEGFDREEMLATLAEIGARLAGIDRRLDLGVYGGAALLLASNFRARARHLDAAPLSGWSREAEAEFRAVGERRGLSRGWFPDGLAHALKPRFEAEDHFEPRRFPTEGEAGLVLHLAGPELMLALKLRALRLLDADADLAAREAADIVNLMAVTGRRDPDAALAVLARHFPGSETGWRRFLLAHLDRFALVHPDPRLPDPSGPLAA